MKLNIAKTRGDTQNHVDWVMDTLNYEIRLLKRWFEQDFPESTLRVHVDLDKIKNKLTIIHEVLTGKEMADNQASMRNGIKIEERNLFNQSFMSEFFRVYNQEVRKELSRAINIHFHNEKSKELLQ